MSIIPESVVKPRQQYKFEKLDENMPLFKDTMPKKENDDYKICISSRLCGRLAEMEGKANE